MAKREIVAPENVVAPKKRWSLYKVVHNDDGAAVAVGMWDGSPYLAMRWNGTQDNPVGTPQSRGLAVWFLVPEHFWRAIISTLSPNGRSIAEAFLKYALDELPNKRRKA